MNYFYKLNIAQRLRALEILLASGLLIVALAYLLVSNIQSHSRNETERLHQVSIYAEKANYELLKSRRFEKDFLIYRDEAYISDFKEQMSHVKGTFAKIKPLTESKDDLQLINAAEKYARLYEETFLSVVQKQIELGLNENIGLHGKMRKAVHNIESKLPEINNLKLDRSMLMMRRHEKDYMARVAPKYIDRMAKEYENFQMLVKETRLDSTTQDEILKLAEEYHSSFLSYVDGLTIVNRAIETLRNAAQEVEPLFAKVVASSLKKNSQNTEITEEKSSFISIVFFVILVFVAAITIFTLIQISRDLKRSLQKLGGTIQRISEGDYDARTKLESNDEIGSFSRTFDTLLDERVATLAKAEKENIQLNDSVIDLIEAVAQLSEKDLTVKLKVAEDVTGPVADSMNMMVQETGDVLKQVQDIAAKVKSASEEVQKQGNRVAELAKEEQRVVTSTIQKLSDASSTMSKISKVAQSCNSIAAETSRSTQDALKAVNDTEEGMEGIRETISEAEKRIKRLGERSQEITGVVDTINSIAERTHVLALNASMQAAAAGDAGRGFAVVADEVQRLAESSRQSTSEIGVLVNNIQSETAEAMATMNKTISQVVEGTKLAKLSGKQMMTTQETAEELAASVAQIAKHSSSQAKTSIELLNEAKSIEESTQVTDSELKNQNQQANDLLTFSENLIRSVMVFKLPG